MHYTSESVPLKGQKREIFFYRRLFFPQRIKANWSFGPLKASLSRLYEIVPSVVRFKLCAFAMYEERASKLNVSVNLKLELKGIRCPDALFYKVSTDQQSLATTPFSYQN